MLGHIILTMATTCLVPLILAELQAINLVSTSLLPSLLLITLTYPSKIDHVKSKFQLCIEEELENCEKTPKDEDLKHLELCIINSYEVFIKKFYIENEYDPVLHKALHFINLYFDKYNFVEMPDNYVRFIRASPTAYLNFCTV